MDKDTAISQIYQILEISNSDYKELIKILEAQNSKPEPEPESKTKKSKKTK